MTNTETAVTVIEPQAADSNVIEWQLDAFPVNDFNRLVPVETIQMPTDLLRPVVQVVRLSPDEKAGDVYSSKDMPAGHAAPTKVGLRKLATAAGISFTDERRTDDGSDPNVIEVSCTAEMLLPNGTRIRATGTKRVDLEAQTWASPQHRAKFKSFFFEHVASRAQNRAIRALLSLRGSYPAEVYRKPFAVVSFAPNMANAEIRKIFLEGAVGAAAQLFGGSAPTKQLQAGSTINVTPAPEEDPAPATPTVLPGEKIAKAGSDEPEWMRDSAPAPKPAAKVDFPTSIRDTAAAVEDPDLLATEAEIAALRKVFTELGLGGSIVGGGIRALWSDQDVTALAGGQARAIVTVHDSLGGEAFKAAWTKLADAAAVTA